MKAKLKFIAIAFILIALLAGAILLKNAKSNNKSIYGLNPEDRRAMNYNLVTDDDAKIPGNDYVLFNAYFLRDLDNDGYAEKYDGTCRNIKENAMLYMDVNVLTEGKLVDGQITINGQNFNLEMAMLADDVLKENYIRKNVTDIKLKDINAGTQKIIFGKISPNLNNNINNYSSNSHSQGDANNVVNTITFKGTYVPLEGDPVEINKTIYLDVDWYGTVTAKVDKKAKYDILEDEIEDNEIKFSFAINDIDNQLILKENINKVEIPELCGYAPVEVKCTTKGVTSNYNEETKELTIIRESVVDENGIVNSKLARFNTYDVAVKYPEDAYRAISSYDTIEFDIEGFYTGYNNKNKEFENPYRSNIAYDKVQFIIRKEPKEKIFNFYVDYIDKHYVESPYRKYVISNQDIINAYNNENIPENKKFTIRWRAVRGDQGEVSSMIMSETKESESYGDKWDTVLIEDYIVNTGIYFTGADSMLGDEGSIKVYDDDTNELVKEFTKDEWNTYDKSNPFKYESGIKHIRVETSKANTDSALCVFNIKELNTYEIINKYTVEQIMDFNATFTYLTGICNIEGLGARDRETADIAYFIHEKSRAKLSLSKETLIVYEKLNNEIINIDTVRESMDDAKWQNGEFLVEVPEEIMYMEINSVTCNKPGVEIEAYDLYQDENGKYFIKIITKNDEPENYRIAIDCNLVSDPRVATVNKIFKLYAYNEFTQEYIPDIIDTYDVNGNNNKTEMVGTAETKLTILSPTSLITMETVTDYDETTDSEITIAPNVALVNREERQAKINIHLTNNYTNTISDIKVLGKIPYKNNTYILNGKDLKSEFTTEITENGINIPNEIPSNIRENTVIYYSEKQNPTKDIQNDENGWKAKEEVEDWSKIVSYLICIDDCKIANGQELKFDYDVTLPENVTLNMASFSTHAVYFNLNTEDGKIKLYTEPTKVGVRIIKKYELELTKYKLNSSVKIPGVTYLLKYNVKNAEGEIEEKQNIVTTDENGKISIQGLYADIEYTLKEIKTPVECVLNDEEIKFIVDDNDRLTVTGNNKRYSYDNNKLELDFEDEITAKLRINKTQTGTGLGVSNVIFDIADEDGNHFTEKTKNGFLEIQGLSLGKTYTLTEKSTPNAVEKKDGAFKFKLTRQGLTDINIEVLESELLKEECVLENNENEISPVVNVNIENELRYNLNINKKDNEGNAIKNVKFELKSESNPSNKVVTQTSSDGECSFNRLSLGETYILKEISASGYYFDKENDYITFKLERDGGIKISKFEKNGNVKVIEEPSIEENGINLNLNVTIENEKIPTYDLKIIKKNEEGFTLKNARFKLTRLFDGKEEAIRVDENGEYIFKGLYENVEGKNAVGEYELVETFSPEGYRLNNTVMKFSATRDANGKLVFTDIQGGEIIRILPDSGDKEISSDEQTVTIGIVNKPLFSLFKIGENGVLLPNAKFIITDMKDNPAKDAYGNYIGEFDETNNAYVVKTDNEGKITANIAKGTYKAIEIEAPEGYVLPTEIKDRIYFFGIDESQDATYSDYEGELSWEKKFDGTSFRYIWKANDNGVIALAFESSSLKLIKYTPDGEMEWSKGLSDSVYLKSATDQGYEVIAICGNAEFEYDGHKIPTVQGKTNYVSVRINNNGEYIEGNSFEIGENVRYISENELGNILFTKDNEIYEYDKQGTLQNTIVLNEFAGATGRLLIQNSPNGYLVTLDGANGIAYYNKSGELKWMKTLDSYVWDISINNENEFVVVTEESSGYSLNDIVKIFDESGNEKYSNTIARAYGGTGKNTRIKNIVYIDANGNEKNGLMFIIDLRFSNFTEYNYIKVYDNNLNFLWEIKGSDLNQDKKVLSDAEKIENTYYVIGYENGTGSLIKYEGAQLYPEIAAAQEITVNNELKKYDITTEISGSGNGGSITGIYNDKYESWNNIKFVEEIKHGYKNEQEIVIEPNTGYYVQYVTVDGEKVSIEPDENGKVIIPSGYFENVTQDHHIVVKFAQKRSTILIKKTDKDGNPLNGAKFRVENQNNGEIYISGLTNEQGEVYVDVEPYNTYKIKEIQAPDGYILSDEEKEIYISNTNNNVITFVDDKKPVITIKKNDEQGNPLKDAKFEVKNKEYKFQLGDLTANGSSYFSKKGNDQYPELIGDIINVDADKHFIEDNGKYIPNNLNDTNVRGDVCSCFKIDLTNQSDDYLVEVDVTEDIYTTSIPYEPCDGFWVYLSEGENYSLLSASSVNPQRLEGGMHGGKVYYLNFMYNQYPYSNYNRTLSIDDIRLYKANSTTYYFAENNGVYEPNNCNKINSDAWSYIPLDLSNCKGKYEITVNAELNTPNETTNSGYVYITENTDIPNINNTNGCIARLSDSDKIDPSDYSKILEGGKQYYIHLGYKKGAQDNGSSDVVDFKINSLEVKQIISKDYVTTDDNGIAIIAFDDFVDRIVKEVEAPEGYVLSDESQEIIITRENPDHTVPFVNRKGSKVIVHHYLQGTGEEYNNEPVELAEEEIKYGISGTQYTTSPNMEIQGYTLVKKENGEYEIPQNAVGTYTTEDQHVYYYYNTSPVQLVVHHYLEGTENKLADDESSTYNKGQHYKTSPSEEVLKQYDLVRVIGDEEKDIEQDEEVTYYYVKKQHKITTRVETISYFGKPEKGGEISGEEENPYETVEHGESNIKEIKMTPKEGFKIDQVVINQLEGGIIISSDEVEFTPEGDGTYVLPQIQNVKNDYEIVVRYVPERGKVIVHHIIEGTEIKIVPDEIIIDEYGNVIETKPIDTTESEVTENYKKYILVQSPSEPNVICSSEDQEVTYYYNVQYKITTEVVLHDEIVDGETVKVKGGNITGENEKPYEVVVRGNDSTKVIKITPDEDYRIKEIKINGETLDFTDKLAEDGTVTLDNFTNMMEDKHITVEFEEFHVDKPAKVIVKYLEEGTNKELKSEDKKDGLVGEDYTTTRAEIDGYEKAGNDPINAKGKMTKEDIVVIYYYKKIEEPVEPDKPDVPDEPVNPHTPSEEDNQNIGLVQPSESEQNNNVNNKENSPQTGDDIIKTVVTAIIATLVFILLGNKRITRKNNKGYGGKHIK